MPRHPTTAANDVSGHAAARVMPFREQPVETATLHVAGVSPQRWKAGLPDADLAIDATVAPLDAPLPTGGANPFRATLHIVNGRPGPIDRERIPIATLDAALDGDSVAIAVSRLDADLGAAGRVGGSAGYVMAGGGAPSFDGTVRALDLRAIDGKLIASKFAGPLAVSRRDGVVRLDTTLNDAGRSVRLRGEFDGHEVRVAEAKVRIGGSGIDASGRIGLDRDRPFDVAGTLAHVDPHDFGDFAKADVNAAFRASGTIGATPAGREPQVFRVAADVRIDPSRVAGRPLAGTVVGTVDGSIASAAKKGTSPVTIRQVIGARVALNVGADRITADGDFGRPQDRLRWTVDAPRLADLELGVTGTLTGNGFVGGSLAQPSIDFTIAGDDLRVTRPTAAKPAATAPAAPVAKTSETVYSVKSLRGTGRLLAGETGTLDADIALTDFRDAASGPPTVRAAQVKVAGTRATHRLTITASSDRFDFTAAADGGLDAGNTWRGTVTELTSRGRMPFALDGTTPLVVGPARVEVGAARLQFAQGRLDLARLDYADDRLATAGTATGFPLSLAGTFSRDFDQRVATTLTFGGRWDLRIGDAIDGTVRIYRESGNIRFLTEPRIDVEPERLELDRRPDRRPHRREDRRHRQGARRHPRVAADAAVEARRPLGPRRRRAARADERRRHPRPALGRAARRRAGSRRVRQREGRADRQGDGRPAAARGSRERRRARHPLARPGRQRPRRPRRPRLRRRPRRPEAGDARGRRRPSRPRAATCGSPIAAPTARST